MKEIAALYKQSRRVKSWQICHSNQQIHPLVIFIRNSSLQYRFKNHMHGLPSWIYLCIKIIYFLLWRVYFTFFLNNSICGSENKSLKKLVSQPVPCLENYWVLGKRLSELRTPNNERPKVYLHYWSSELAYLNV